MTNMMRLSRHIIAVTSQNFNWITNLQLQKILYFVLVEGFRRGILDRQRLETIYDQPFEAWLYGPVAPSVYNEFKHNGANQIIENFETDPEFDDIHHLNELIEQLSKDDVFSLVEESHEHDVWKKNKTVIERKKAYTDIHYKINDLMLEDERNGR